MEAFYLKKKKLSTEKTALAMAWKVKRVNSSVAASNRLPVNKQDSW